MNKQYDLIIVIPVGPNCKAEYIIDTIKSVIYYTSCKFKIIISDDSQKQTGNDIKKIFAYIDVITTTKVFGLQAGLYITLSNVYKFAINNYNFNLLLRLDTDALITGFEPQAEAVELFKKNPKIALAGLYRRGIWPRDSFDNKINNFYPRMRIISSAFGWRIIQRPVANFTMRKIALKAFLNGYELGENIFGGAYFISKMFLIKLDEEGLLPNYKLKYVQLEEDHIFSMLVKYFDFDFGDLESGNLPFGCSWKGLPASPAELYNRGKKIIHSTRLWKDMKEPEIRQYFRNKRI